MNNYQTQPLTPEEISRLIAHTRTTRNPERDTLIILLSIKAGLTTSRIANLKLKEIIDKDFLITLSLDGTPLTSEIRAQVERYLQERFSLDLPGLFQLNAEMNGLLLDLHLLASQKRGHFTDTTLPSLIRDIYQRARVNGRPSSGRQTFIKRLTRSGLDLSQIRLIAKVTPETLIKYLPESDLDVRKVIEMM